MPACLQTLCPESRTKAALPGTPRTLSLQQPPDPLREPCLGFSPPQHPPARSLSAGTDLRKLNAHLPKPLEMKIHHRCVSRLPPGKPGSILFPVLLSYFPQSFSEWVVPSGWFRVGGSAPRSAGSPTEVRARWRRRAERCLPQPSPGRACPRHLLSKARSEAGHGRRRPVLSRLLSVLPLGTGGSGRRFLPRARRGRTREQAKRSCSSTKTCCAGSEAAHGGLGDDSVVTPDPSQGAAA